MLGDRRQPRRVALFADLVRVATQLVINPVWKTAVQRHIPADRLALELCGLAALAYGGWRAGGPLWLRLPLAIALPLLAAAIWGRWVAPRAKHLLADPLRLVPEWVVFGGATFALAATGHPVKRVAIKGRIATPRNCVGGR